MYPNFGPPKDRPHQGPSLKIHEGLTVRGGTSELNWQLDLDFCNLALTCVLTPFFFALQRYALGLECDLKGTGRKVGPML